MCNIQGNKVVLKSLILVMVLITMTQCVHIEIPEQAWYKRVLNMPYTEDFVCKDKAKLYWQKLKEKGYDVKIAVGEAYGFSHSWVVYTTTAADGEKIRRLIDPTIHQTYSGFPIEYYNDYKVSFYLDAISGADFIIINRED